MTMPPADRWDTAAGSRDAEPIPPMPPDAMVAATRYYRPISAGLPALVKSVRDRCIASGDAEAYARLVHALSHCDPENVCRIGAAAIMQLTSRAA